MSDIWFSKTAGARTEQLRRLTEWKSRRAGQPLNTYSASQEAYTSGVVAGRVAAVDSGCCVGDFYMVGRYATNPLAIYDSNGQRSDVSLNSVNSRNTVYLLKYNRNGIAQWGAKIGSTTNTSDTPIVVSVGTDVYVCGIVTGTELRLYNADDDSTPAASLTLDASTNKIWLAKYSSDGAVQWATYVSDSGSLTRPYVAVDSASNVYLAGRFATTMQIYQAGLTQVGTLTADASGNADNFLIKYNSAGAYQWSTKIGGLGNDTVPNVVCDHVGNVYISAFYDSSTLSVYNAGGALAFTIGNSGNYDNYLVKYNSVGIAQWGTHVGGTNIEANISITVDLINNVYLSASFSSSLLNIYSQGNPVPAFTLTNSDLSGNGDIYIAKYSASGVAQWATRIGSTRTEQLPCLTTDKFNNVFVYGLSDASQLNVYSSSNQVTPALTLTPGAVSTSNPIVFLAKYNTNGIASWVTRIEGSNTGGFAYRPIITSDGTNTYLTAVYGVGTLNIYDQGATVTPVRTLTNSSGAQSTFIIKYDAGGYSQWAAQTLAAINPNIYATF